MVGENKRDRCDFPTGVEKELPPIDSADDHLEVEKMNALGGAGDEVERRSNQASEEVVKVSDKDQARQKKPRFIWTREVHHCFLQAVDQIGFHKAVPTKILALMNVENLTRENVASHLQKYRHQVKRKEKERAHAYAASFPKGVHPHTSGIHQQPRVIPNTMHGINADCVSLDGSQLAPTIQEVYGTPFQDLFDLFDEDVNRMSDLRLMHDLYDPHDINKIGHNYGQFPPKPLVDSYAHNLMDRHDMTFVPQCYRRDDCYLQDIISPFVPQCDRRDELSLRGITSPLAVEGHGAGMTRLPEATGGPRLGVPRMPEASGGHDWMLDCPGMPRMPEAGGGHDWKFDFQPGFPFVDDVEVESSIDSNDFRMKRKGDVDGKSLDGFTFR